MYIHRIHMYMQVVEWSSPNDYIVYMYIRYEDQGCGATLGKRSIGLSLIKALCKTETKDLEMSLRLATNIPVAPVTSL